MKNQPEKTIASVKITLDPRAKKDDSNKKLLVHLKVFYQRKWRAYGIGHYLTPFEFELYLQGSKKADIKAFSRLATEQIVKANQIIDSLGDDFTFARFKRAFNGEKVNSKPTRLYDYFEKAIAEKKVDQTTTTYKVYENTLSSLKAFCKTNPEFKEVDVDFLNRYSKWFLSTPYGKSQKLRSESSLSIYLRTLRAVLNMAIEDGMMKQEQYPFSRKRGDKRKVKVPATRNVKKALTLDQIKQIVNYIPKTDSEAFCRDLWLFSYLCNGMNLKDIALLEYKDVTENGLKVTREKTKNNTQKATFIPLLNLSKSIIEKWGNKDKSPTNRVFNLIPKDIPKERFIATKNQRIKVINDYMSRIFETLELGEYLGLMSARHSFATVLKRSGASVEQISEAMHNGNIKTTQAYLDSFEDEAKIEMQKKLVDF